MKEDNKELLKSVASLVAQLGSGYVVSTVASAFEPVTMSTPKRILYKTGWFAIGLAVNKACSNAAKEEVEDTLELIGTFRKQDGSEVKMYAVNVTA